MYQYYCAACGHKFENSLPERDEHGLLNDISCPECGVWDIYPDTDTGHTAELRAFIEYENKIEGLAEDEEA